MTPMRRLAYLAHAQSNAHLRRVAEALHLIERHRGYGVCVSWGKDSIVLLHLALRALGGCVAVHARYSIHEELPDIPIVRDSCLSSWASGAAYTEVPVWGDWELYERAGRFFLDASTPRERDLVKDFKAQLDTAVTAALEAAGAEGKMLGMAAHESRGRAMNIARRGQSYTAAGQMPKLLPLAHWTSRDVMAYMLHHDLPLLRAYTDSDDPERARSEVAFGVISASASDALRRHGVWDEWRRIYPDLWRDWQLRWFSGADSTAVMKSAA